MEFDYFARESFKEETQSPEYPGHQDSQTILASLPVSQAGQAASQAGQPASQPVSQPASQPARSANCFSQADHQWSGQGEGGE